MAASDLAVLQDVKDWLGAGGGTPVGTGGDPVLKRLITACSGAIYSYLSRQVIIPQTITERYDGVGINRIQLRNWPVLSISSLLVNGVTFNFGTYPTTASTSQGWPPNGSLFSPWDGLLPGKPQILDWYGNLSNTNGAAYGFSFGRQNVQVTYLCGYAVRNEAAIIPSDGSNTVAVQAPLGPWASDLGVVYADTGVALTPETDTDVLAQGQYVPPTMGQPNEDGAVYYTFAAADAGAAILISYGFIPAALNTACIDWVAERYRYAARIGQKSQTVSGQQTASYDVSGVPATIKMNLDPYRNVVPFPTWY